VLSHRAPPSRRAALVLAAVVVLGAGCSVRRIEDGVFHSPKGYRVAIPGSAWTVVERTDADLELRHRALPAGMVAHAECGSALARRGSRLLERNLLLGLRERRVIERGDGTMDGQPATRLVLDAAAPPSPDPIRVEAWTMTDGRCVYDLVFAAPPSGFDPAHVSFARFVSSFRRDPR
jgi:hypothetical protein